MAEAKRLPISARVVDMFKKSRALKGWSQSELATKAKVPRARIKRLECRELSTIDSKEFLAISRALGLAVPKGGHPKDTSPPRKPSKKRKARKGSVETQPTKRGGRQIVIESLEKVGILDLTLRDLLSRTKTPRIVSLVIDS